MAERLGDAPIEDAYREKMNALASAIDEFFNEGVRGKDRQTGFVLLVFPFGEKEGRCNYISNGADRRDVVTLFKEQIKRFEGQPGRAWLKDTLIRSEIDDALMKKMLLKCYGSKIQALRISTDHYRYLAEQVVALREHIKRMPESVGRA